MQSSVVYQPIRRYHFGDDVDEDYMESIKRKEAIAEDELEQLSTMEVDDTDTSATM